MQTQSHIKSTYGGGCPALTRCAALQSPAPGDAPVEELMAMASAAGWRCEVQFSGQRAQAYGIELAGALHVLRAHKPAVV